MQGGSLVPALRPLPPRLGEVEAAAHAGPFGGAVVYVWVAVLGWRLVQSPAVPPAPPGCGCGWPRGPLSVSAGARSCM